MLGGVSLAATLPALWALDKVGRRKMLFWGAIAEAICAIIAGLAGHFMLPAPGTPTADLTSRNKTGGGLLIAFAVLQIACFSFFCECCPSCFSILLDSTADDVVDPPPAGGPTPWVYLGESFPLRVRPKCIALGSATNWCVSGPALPLLDPTR